VHQRHFNGAICKPLKLNNWRCNSVEKQPRDYMLPIWRLPLPTADEQWFDSGHAAARGLGRFLQKNVYYYNIMSFC
jgi:hypothetical protein